MATADVMFLFPLFYWPTVSRKRWLPNCISFSCYGGTVQYYCRAACNFSPYFDGSPTVIDKRYQWWSRQQLDAIHTDAR